MSESIRDRIARVLHRQATDDGEVHVLWGGVEEHEDEVAEWLPFADALLARWPVLAGVTDEMVENGARAAFDQAFMKYAPEHIDRWDDLVADNDPAVQSWRDVSRAVLAAVLGSRDADAPGDGSTA